MIACIDIGGTSIKVGVYDKGLKEKTSLPVGNDFNEFVDNIVEFVKEMKTKYDIEGIAFSAPGAVDTKTGIIGGASAIPFIHGPNFKEIFKDRLSLNVSIENDANCAALGEVYFGSAKGHKDVCFVVCGSGIGGAIVKDGLIHHGKHLHGGEFGYMIVNDHNGKMPILSEVASTQALVRRVEKQLNEKLDGIEIFKRANEGNEVCKEEIENFYHYLALGIYNIQYIYDPELIVLGGAISSREDLCENVSRHLDIIIKEVRIAKVTPKVVKCKYSGDANLLGALVNYSIEYKGGEIDA